MPQTPRANETHIDWNMPEPQTALDHVTGPGATRAELIMQFAPTLIIASVGLSLASNANLGWNLWQFSLFAILLVDMIGGVITNATSSAKRWYHRPSVSRAQHLGFVALHAAQPLLIVITFAPDQWHFFFLGFGYLLAATLVLLATPLYLQRPVAGLLVALGIFAGLYLVASPSYFEWFLPVYYLKVLCCHLLREEPYRPATAGVPVRQAAPGT